MLLIITQNSLEEEKCQKIQSLIKNISKSFNSLNKHSFILCVNQATEKLNSEIIKDIIN